MEFAEVARTRSDCCRRKVGAVIVKNKMVISTGYNGAPRGFPEQATCIRDGLKSGDRPDLSCCIHAEQNAIIQAARHGIAVDGATLYCTNHPCTKCLQMLINAGISSVVYAEGYPDPECKRVAALGGVTCREVTDEVEPIS